MRPSCSWPCSECKPTQKRLAAGVRKRAPFADARRLKESELSARDSERRARKRTPPCQERRCRTTCSRRGSRCCVTALPLRAWSQSVTARARAKAAAATGALQTERDQQDSGDVSARFRAAWALLRAARTSVNLGGIGRTTQLR